MILAARGIARLSRSSASASIYSSVRQREVTATVGETEFNFSNGKIARLADGSVLVQAGGTAVLVTAVSEGFIDESFFGAPLKVVYRDKGAAARRIPATFGRRELQATVREILTSRAIDRSLRPLQLPGYPFETQVTCYVLAYDGTHDPAIMAINGASAAMAVSNIPWSGPVGAVRVGMVGKELIVNPSRAKVCKELNVIVVATDDRLVMVEGEAVGVDEATFCEAVTLGLESVQPIISAIKRFGEEHGKVKRSFEPFVPPDYVEHHMDTFKDQIVQVLKTYSHSKTSRDNNLFGILNVAKEQLLGSHELTNVRLIQDSFWKLVRGCYSNQIIDCGVRCDGRLLDELRPISCETNIFNELHGSSLFRRGETEVFSSVTMDVPDRAGNPDIIAAVIGKEKPKKFMLHYDFPSFATNTVSRGAMFQRRRETGHGMLAEKAVQSQTPSDFPFTIRVSCDVTDSNGSSSMASVCGASLALFDAGIPMTTATAGVACGLITQSSIQGDGIHGDGSFPKYKILTDISGFEDASGNMDFKVAGTRTGITSIQVDVKHIRGLPLDVFKEAIYTSQEARNKVLDIMDDTISSPRSAMKESTPCSYVLEVPAAKRAMVFSSGSNSVKAKVQEEEIYFQDISDTTVGVYAPNKHILEQALPKVKALLIDDDEGDLEIGQTYNFPVAEIRPYGVLLQVTPTTTSLLHVNEMSTEVLQRFNKKALKVSDEVNAYYIGRKDMGRLGVTQKVAIVTEAVRKHKASDSKE